MTPTPLGRLIQRRLRELGIRSVHFAARLGYRNMSKGSRRIDQVCRGDLAHKEQLSGNSPKALDLPDDVVAAATDATRSQVDGVRNVVGTALVAAAEQRRQAEPELERIAAIVEYSDDAIMGNSLEGRITSWNTGAARIFGYTARETIGQPITRVIPPELHGEEEQILSRLKRGERIEPYETTRLTKDGRRIDISLTVSPVRDKAGKVIGASKVARDITARKRAEEHMAFLMRELSHRTKNVMAVVEAIAWQTARNSVDLKNFEQSFMQRLEALGRSHDLLLKRDWKGVVLEDLVREQLEPFLDTAKVSLATHCPALVLMPLAAQELGMALHELATNASKYGALSVPTGRIEVNWTIDNGAASERRFRMTWRETGGPAAQPPVHKGFGSTVITRMLSNTFKGNAEVEYAPEGLSWELAAPLGDCIMELPSRVGARGPGLGPDDAGRDMSTNFE
jgi:PAS domain S-box-containing protein